MGYRCTRCGRVPSAACTAHREGQVFRREYEYTIREYEVDRPEV